ncbi:hypothetical protein BCR35DRAFT_334918 [Leucosporidium creatinivorum]|uniref:F-box domain-containing protein n=1 Tax=Leucosporidium creatinivorum TaxID=106004 RepID=A0A1Y2DRZ4_9BASI|nr:hypothetical protein BCR35DRAFT_334918 [Leucosporidium creatinivorum]
MVLPSLPPEIITAIIRQTNVEYGGRSNQARDSAACCLVSKCFLQFAREALYLDLYLSYEHSNTETRRRRVSQLLATLTSSPHLAALVRRLGVAVSASGDDLDEIEKQVGATLEACRSVLSLSLWLPTSLADRPTPPTVERSLQDIGGQLTSFSLYGKFWTLPMDDLFSSFGALGSLQIDTGALGTLRSSPLFQLRKFSISLENEGVEFILPHLLLKHSQSTLVKLELDLDDLPTAPALNLSSFVALRELDITCDLGVWQRNNITEIMKLLKTRPTLQQLQLRHPLDFVHPPPRLESTNLLQLLPPSLISFGLCSPPLSTEYILDALADTRSLLGLKRLALDYHAVQDPDEDDDTFPDVRELSELEEIKEAAAKRGIMVDWPGLEELEAE